MIFRKIGPHFSGSCSWTGVSPVPVFRLYRQQRALWHPCLLIQIPRHALPRRALRRADIARRGREDVLPRAPLLRMRHAFEREAQAAGRFAAAAALPAARLVAAGPPQGERVAIAALLQRLLDLHALWRLPDGDADYATRWSLFKSGFSRGLPA